MNEHTKLLAACWAARDVLYALRYAYQSDPAGLAVILSNLCGPASVIYQLEPLCGMCDPRAAIASAEPQA